MPRPRKPPTPDAPALFDGPAAPSTRRGRHARALDTAVAAARKRGALPTEHSALVSLCRALARALDLAERTEQVYAVAQLSREYRAALSDARLVPVEGPPADPFAALLADLDDAPTT